MIANQDAEAPDAVFNTKDILKDKLMNLLEVLDEREKSIVGDYFGLTGTPRTLEDIGSDFGLTKERVRQIKEKALRRLRNDSSELFDSASGNFDAETSRFFDSGVQNADFFASGNYLFADIFLGW